MIAALDTIEWVVILGIPALGIVGGLAIWIGSLGSKEPGMLHENEPPGEKQWRSAEDKL